MSATRNNLSAGTGSPPSVISISTKQDISQIPEVEESKEVSHIGDQDGKKDGAGFCTLSHSHYS